MHQHNPRESRQTQLARADLQRLEQRRDALMARKQWLRELIVAQARATSTAPTPSSPPPPKPLSDLSAPSMPPPAIEHSLI